MNIPAVACNLLSAGFGITGSILLYRGSFAFESLPFWGGEGISQEVTDRNRNRQHLQRAGIACIGLGFLLQAMAQLLDL